MLRLCEAGRIAAVQFILQHADVVPQVTIFFRSNCALQVNHDEF